MIIIPDKFNKNHPKIKELGVEKTGEFIINQIINRTKIDLSDSNVLDVGCGTRFTATIINQKIAIKSYVGIDLDSEMIDFLIANIKDKRFSFHCVYYQNDMYNKLGKPLSEVDKFPVDLTNFDLICMFSVITHQNPNSAQNLFRICRKHIKEKGKMVFSAFIDNEVQEFLDKNSKIPLLEAYYNQTYLQKLLEIEGWNLESLYPPDKQKITQHFLVCSPL